MEEDDFEEPEYWQKGWDNNVENCNIDVLRSVMISDDLNNAEYNALQAGHLLGKLNIEVDDAEMHSCGKWHWLVFKDESMAVAFKLLWENMLTS